MLDPLIQIKVTSAVGSLFATVSTITRLIIRRKRYWIDDGFAFFSMLALLVQVAGIFMHVRHPTHISQVNRVAAYYLIATSFYAIIWSARLAILFSVIRLHPHLAHRRRLLFLAASFLLTYLILTAQLFWVCEPEKLWKEAPNPQCVLNKEVAIAQLISDVFADSILIAVPIQLFTALRDVWLRRCLLVIFSTCIVTTIVSLVHAVYILRLGGVKVVIAACVEDCMSLIVCNIPVIITAWVRLDEINKARNDMTVPSFIHPQDPVPTWKTEKTMDFDEGRRQPVSLHSPPDRTPSLSHSVSSDVTAVSFAGSPASPVASSARPDTSLRTPVFNTYDSGGTVAGG